MKRSAVQWVVVSSFVALTCFNSGLVAAAGPCEPGWQPIWAPFPRPLEGSCGPAPTATVYDDGTGPAVYVGGSCYDQVGGIKDKIFRWDGTAWSGLGMRDEDWGRPRVLVVYRSELIAAGGFQSVAGVTAHGIARWNGKRWAPLAGPDGKEGVDGPIMTATVYKDELIISGYFTQAGGVPCNWIARWDGTNWSPVGKNGGLTPSDPHLAATFSACVHLDDFYLGGLFEGVDGVAAHNIARWDGVTWSALQAGGQNGLPSGPFDMTVYQGKLIFGLQPESDEAGFPEAVRTWDGQAFGVLKGNDGNGRFLTVHKGELFSHGGWRGGIRRWNGSFWSKTGPDKWPEIIIEYQGKLLTFAGYDQAQWYEWKLPDFPDSDGDGLADQCDPYPLVPGLLTDSDGDGTIDAIDNCPSAPNQRQHDLDADGIGDMCDDDVDGDAVSNTQDNCPDYANADQADANGDGRGDACQHCFSGTFVMVDNRQYLAVTMTPCNYVEQMPPQPDLLDLPVTLHPVVTIEGEGYRLFPDTPVGEELAIAEGEETTAKTLAEEDTATPACGAGAVTAQLGVCFGLLGLRVRRRDCR